MATILKISRTKTLSKIRKELSKMISSQKPKKSVADFYGVLPNAFGDAVSYQKEIRNEWD